MPFSSELTLNINNSEQPPLIHFKSLQSLLSLNLQSPFGYENLRISFLKELDTFSVCFKAKFVRDKPYIDVRTVTVLRQL